MKKLVLFFALLLSAFLSESSYAITYGGTSNYSIPSVYSNTGVLLYTASAPVTGGVNVNPVFDQKVTESLRMVSWTAGIRYLSGSIGSYSGLVARISQTSCGYGSNWNCYWYNWINIDLMVSTGATHDQYYLVIDKSRGDTEVVRVATINQFTLKNGTTCPGQTPDCILMIQPRLYYKSAGASQGLYLPYIDYTWYYGPDKKSQYFRAYFGDLSENGPNPTFWQSTLEFFGLGVTGYGLYTGWDRGLTAKDDYGQYWGALSYGVGGQPGSNTSGIGYVRNSAPDNDDTLLRDYFVGNTGSIIETLFPAWVDSSGLKVSIINGDGTITDPNSGGGGSSSVSSSSSTGSFANCSGLDFGCYIGGAFNASIDFVLGFFDFSFISTGNSVYCGNDSTFSMTGGISYSGKFSNPLAQKVFKVVSVAIPVSPNEGDSVCTLMGDRIIHYHENSWFDLLITMTCSFGILLILLRYGSNNN